MSSSFATVRVTVSKTGMMGCINKHYQSACKEEVY
jgi:hypothetical protein